MRLFIVVVLIVGAVSGYFCGVDAALWAGKRTVDIWILAWVIIFLSKPFIQIFQMTKAVVQKIYHLFDHNKA